MEQFSYVDQPWESAEASPLLAAIDYLRQHEDALEIDERALEHAQESVSFSEPRDQGVQFRLGQQKDLFDAATIIFNQTYLNVPVWRAAITLTLKRNPSRVVIVTDTTARGMNAPLPSADRIEAHRTVFALALARQSLAARGLEAAVGAVGLATESDASPTAGFLQHALGRDAGEDAVDEGADAIRGRFFVYRYRAECRIPDAASPSESESETEADQPDAPASPPNDPPLPTLDLPAVDASIGDGDWRLVSEVTFALTTAEYGSLNWRALIDVETDSVLFLEPLVSGLTGMVFIRDPITSTGNVALTPASSNAILNSHRSSVTLPNLDAPVSGIQSLRGRFAVVSDVNAPRIAPPTRPANANFDYDVRTNDFAAVNAYYHTDRFFALIENLGFTIASYFDNTTFPVRVDHRDTIAGSANTVNARCMDNGRGGIGFAGYALNDTTNIAAPIGRACDSRCHFHELGGHGILYEHVGHANFRFAHSAGDSMSAIFHDPESMAPDRFRYAPWNSSNARRFDRDVTQGWGWGGSRDIGGYDSEQILCTTLFRAYRSIGGDSDGLAQRISASRTMLYLILRAVSTLTPATNPRNAINFANALLTADLLDWTSARLAGGAYGKVIRWAFEKQGLYQPPGAPAQVVSEGAPPAVDVYIDDGRHGEYPYQARYWDNPSIWNRVAADGGTVHQSPVAGTANYAYVRLANRGTEVAQNVSIQAFQRRPGGGTDWPIDFQPLATPVLSGGTLRPNRTEMKVVGPFPWTPNPNASGEDTLLMVASADADGSNISNFSASETIAEARLVPHDNNIGLRRMAVAP